MGMTHATDVYRGVAERAALSAVSPTLTPQCNCHYK